VHCPQSGNGAVVVTRVIFLGCESGNDNLPHQQGQRLEETAPHPRALDCGSAALGGQTLSEAHSHGQLKGAGAAGAEDLRGPAGGLTEGGARQIAAVAGQVRLIVEVEHFADER
jgi:hypothetical protein